jgi:hypothetical protein
MNASLKDVMRWITTGLMYIVSTIGLSAGLGTALSLGVAISSDGYTLSKNAGWAIGILLGLIIQWLETDHVLHPDEADNFENWFIPFLIGVDGVMLFVALGGHLNIIWMLNNTNDASGMIVHFVGLVGQIVGASIGSYGAEKSLAKVLHIKPGQHPTGDHPTGDQPAAPAEQTTTGYTLGPGGTPPPQAGMLWFPSAHKWAAKTEPEGQGWTVVVKEGAPPAPATAAH